MFVKYLLLEESIFCDENITETEFKDRLIEFLSICEEIVQYKEEEAIIYSSNLYDQYVMDFEFADWLYTDEEPLIEEKKLLRILINQSFKNDDQMYNTYKSRIKDKFSNENLASIHILKKLEELASNEFSIYEMDDCFKVRRLFLRRERDRVNFSRCINRAFPNLYLGESVENSLRHFNPLGDHIGELIIHLTALNEHVITLFENHSHEGQAKVMSLLSSTAGILCSPEGNPHTVETYLKFKFKDNDGNTQKISCSPHTKLYRADSDYRIYFTWNNNILPGLPPILIGHMGGHPYS